MPHSIKSSIHCNTVSASISARLMSLRSAMCAHSSSVISCSFASLSMESFGLASNLYRNL